MKTIQTSINRAPLIRQVLKVAILIFAAAMLTLLFTGKVSAQQNNPLRRGEFGIRYMPTFTSIDLKAFNEDIIQGQASINQGFGVVVGFNLTKNFGFQGEVNYYKVSQSFRDLNVSNEVNIKYLNIPLLLSINTNKEKRLNFNVVAGPQFGINAGASIDVSDTEDPDVVRAVVAVKKGDIGLAYGAGFEFAINTNHTIRLDFGYRGFYGLVDIDADKSENNTYNVIAKASRKTNAAYVGLTILF